MPKYNIVLGACAWWLHLGLLDPPSTADTEFHVSHRMIFLCEMARNWSGLFRLEFFNTAVVFIHPVSKWPFGFSSVLQTTLVVIYNIN